LTKVNTELDKFVYSASHDLRAPLSSILGIINISRLDLPPKARRSTWDSSRKAFENWTLYQRNHRLFAQCATELAVAEISFENQISEIIDNVKYLDEHNRIERNVEVECATPFHTDDKRLAMVLTNLVANAFVTMIQKEKSFYHRHRKGGSSSGRSEVSDNERHCPGTYWKHL